MLTLTQLESRECPAFLGVRDGFVIAADGNDFVPMPDFMAAHYSAGDQFVTVVGAASGGGPRVQVRVDGKVTADFFAYESTFRDGVHVAQYRETVVTGAAPGGGPVVAVYDVHGTQRSRFFAYDPDFRGGVSVAVVGDVVYTVPGPGGGPHIRSFTLDGEPIESFFGAAPDLRDGWSLIVGDVTHDRLDDFVLSDGTGVIHITEGVTKGRQTVKLPPGFTLAGYEGESLTAGNTVDYTRSRALWTSFPTMVEFDFADAAAGLPNPPPTTGTRPGVYRPIGTVSHPSEGEFTTFGEVFVSDSVGSSNIGTGSSFFPMVDDDGNEYIVTASHVVRRNPYDTRVDLLTSPGLLDGPPQPAGVLPARVAPIVEGVPYVVDAAAYPLAPGVTLSRQLGFAGELVDLHGVAVDVMPGDPLIAIGRGRFAGAGRVSEEVFGPTTVRWSDGYLPQITGQIIGERGAVQLAAPGFSGGVCIRVTWDADGPICEIVGMVVAGNSKYVFITPYAAIAAALGLR